MAAKKSSAKKSAKKSASKKIASKKSGAKKSSAKKSVKRAPAKKVAKKSTRKVVKRSTKKSASKISIPPVPLSGARNGSISVSTTPTPRAVAPVVAKPSAAPKSSNRVIVIVFIGIALLAFIVVSNSHKNSTISSSTPSESAAPSMSAAPATSEAATSSAAALANHEAPVGIVAHYTASGATIFWKAPTASEGITGYTIEISSNGGAFAASGKVDAAMMEYPVTKTDSAGWSSFKVSTVYSDGQVIGGKVFGLPGQYSGS